jgi:hypothetical protein
MQGSVPEWLMGVDCKSTGHAYAGSNPARPIFALCPCGSVVEHTLGKGEVTSSILVTGFGWGTITSKAFGSSKHLLKVDFCCLIGQRE